MASFNPRSSRPKALGIPSRNTAFRRSRLREEMQDKSSGNPAKSSNPMLAKQHSADRLIGLANRLGKQAWQTGLANRLIGFALSISLFTTSTVFQLQAFGQFLPGPRPRCLAFGQFLPGPAHHPGPRALGPVQRSSQLTTQDHAAESTPRAWPQAWAPLHGRPPRPLFLGTSTRG